ncbi:MAG: LysM peptidoglycan-binding domain-containing protein [Rhodospirillales bacterium]|nr:MAG: LysM peptidoglycan-binding domain-containing protein [Rhodospirillales bacterium]
MRPGTLPTRQRVSAGVGAASVRAGRTSSARVPVVSAASCSRRRAIGGAAPISPATPARAPLCRPSSKAQSRSVSRPASITIRRSGSRPKQARPGAYSTPGSLPVPAWVRRHHATAPPSASSRPSSRAVKPAAAAVASAATMSCSPARGSPCQGKALSRETAPRENDAAVSWPVASHSRPEALPELCSIRRICRRKSARSAGSGRQRACDGSAGGTWDEDPDKVSGAGMVRDPLAMFFFCSSSNHLTASTHPIPPERPFSDPAPTTRADERRHVHCSTTKAALDSPSLRLIFGETDPVKRSFLVAALGAAVVMAAIILNEINRDPDPHRSPPQVTEGDPARAAQKSSADPGAAAWSAPHEPAPDPADTAITSPEPGTEALAPPFALPTFDVARVTPAGEAVLAGRAEPGARVVVTDQDRPIGTVTADERGEWVFLPAEPLLPGERWIGLEIDPGSSGGEDRGENGGEIGSLLRSEHLLLVIIPDPDADADSALEADGIGEASPEAPRVLVMQVPRAGLGPATVLQSPAEPAQGDPVTAMPLAIGAVDRDAAARLTLSGHAPESAAVNVYVGETFVGQAVADAEGRWLLRPHDTAMTVAGVVRADQVGEDGEVLARVAVPFAPMTADAGPVASSGHTVVIRPGENLWRIARDVYGSGFAYTAIYEANRDQIRDPDLIYPGQVFTLPPVH